MLTESIKSFFKFTLNFIVIFFIIVIFGGVTAIYTTAKGVVWLLKKTQVEKSIIVNLNSASEMQKPSDPVLVKAPQQITKIITEESAIIDTVKRSAPAVVSVIRSTEFSGEIEKRQLTAGSGFIVSSNGYILTNRHVVSDEEAEYYVVLNDKDHFGKKMSAQVLARDMSNDIAILKINLTKLPYIRFGDSDKLRVGQTVIAIGYALGQLDNSVSKGIISGLSRSIRAEDDTGGPIRKIYGLIQTDAAINPGNSGGPLLNIAGNVIGMNIAMADAQSIGFAIPAKLARIDFEQVKTTGKIKEMPKPFLGVRFEPVSAGVQASRNLPYDYGMIIIAGDKPEEVAVVPGSPADKAGIAVNDVILEIDNKQLNERNVLSDVIVNRKPGDVLTFKIYRDGAIKSLRVTLGEKK